MPPHSFYGALADSAASDPLGRALVPPRPPLPARRSCANTQSAQSAWRGLLKTYPHPILRRRALQPYTFPKWKPPSMGSATPFTNAALSEHRNATTCAPPGAHSVGRGAGPRVRRTLACAAAARTHSAPRRDASRPPRACPGRRHARAAPDGSALPLRHRQGASAGGVRCASRSLPLCRTLNNTSAPQNQPLTTSRHFAACIISGKRSAARPHLAHLGRARPALGRRARNEGIQVHARALRVRRGEPGSLRPWPGRRGAAVACA